MLKRPIQKRETMYDELVIAMPEKKRNPKAVRKPLGIQVRGRDEWKAWVEKGAIHCRLSVSTLVDLAITKFLKDQGFNDPPPNR